MIEQGKKVLSQKKSSETRLGLVAEQIAPFLAGCPYDPKVMSFLGQPVDFLVFDYDSGEIVFLEVKSGNSKESSRQKLIKNIIKSGKVYYEKMRINEKGVKIIREKIMLKLVMLLIFVNGCTSSSFSPGDCATKSEWITETGKLAKNIYVEVLARGTNGKYTVRLCIFNRQGKQNILCSKPNSGYINHLKKVHCPK